MGRALRALGSTYMCRYRSRSKVDAFVYADVPNYMSMFLS